VKLSFGRKIAVFAASVCLASVLWVSSASAAQVTVVQGDSLWAIANRTGTSVDAIKQLNNLDSDLLHPGDVLNIPDGTEQTILPVSSQQSVSRGGLDRDRIVAVLNFAKQYEGTRYRSGGESPAGFDCSGFVRYVFKNFGFELVHSAVGQYNSGTAVDVANLRPGDLVFFHTYGKGISHSGIYLGGNQFISSTSSSGVKIDNLYDGYWGPKFRGACRILP